MVVSIKSNDFGRSLRLVVENLGDGGKQREISLGRSPDGSMRGHPSAAVIGDVLAVAAQFGRSSYVLYFVDTKKMRLAKTAKLSMPPLTEDGMTDGHAPYLAAGPDRFGVAIGHSDELVWLEYDVRGRERVPPRVLTNSLAVTTKPWVVWAGENFSVLTNRTVGSGFSSRQAPELLSITPDGAAFKQLTTLDGFALTPETRTWVVSGRLIFEGGAHFLAAKTYPLSVSKKSKFQLFRVGRSGAVEARECPDIDEE
ncbi:MULTISPECIES: hypothetical protein [Myxococcaceae]|uniref:hypothetical protein n=1 Tax=Myxococcaceae TaxID=31 RepID=UPI0012FD4B6E|nr:MULTISPECIES: hypothetical protein [Myxococcaceae]NVJ16756.1 hypothetical protein [Myxococcus sp. AM010]